MTKLLQKDHKVKILLYDEARECIDLVGKVDSGEWKILEETMGVNFLTVFPCVAVKSVAFLRIASPYVFC